MNFKKESTQCIVKVKAKLKLEAAAKPPLPPQLRQAMPSKAKQCLNFKLRSALQSVLEKIEIKSKMFFKKNEKIWCLEKEIYVIEF